MNLRLILLTVTVIAAITVPSTQAQGVSESGSIGSRDSLEILVHDEKDLATRGMLSPSGTIDMPLIGSVRLVGLTTTQAAREIEAKLRDGYLVRPQVTVSITGRVRQTVTVIGQVQRPGVFLLDPNRQLTLVEAIGMAGGMTRIANEKRIALKRRGQDRPLQLNFQLIAAGQGQDVPLRDGDIITIPESLF